MHEHLHPMQRVELRFLTTCHYVPPRGWTRGSENAAGVRVRCAGGEGSVTRRPVVLLPVVLLSVSLLPVAGCAGEERRRCGRLLCRRCGACDTVSRRHRQRSLLPFSPPCPEQLRVAGERLADEGVQGRQNRPLLVERIAGALRRGGP